MILFDKRELGFKGKNAESRKEASSVKTLHQEEPPPLPVRRGCQLNRSETTTTGGCPAISGATPILSVLSAPGWPSCLY